MNRMASWLIVLFSVALVVSPAQAGLTGLVWPAPGGTSYSMSGNSGQIGGLTISYSGFDSAQYGQLYWGPWDPSDGGVFGASLNGLGVSGSEVMTLQGFSNSQAIWTGTSTWSYESSGYWYNNVSIATRLTLTVTGASLINASTVGENVGVLASVNGDYTANLLFEASFPAAYDYYSGYVGAGWKPVNSGYDLYHTPSGARTDLQFSGGYYYSAAVPEPASLLLVGSGLVGVAAFRRRFKKS